MKALLRKNILSLVLSCISQTMTMLDYMLSLGERSKEGMLLVKAAIAPYLICLHAVEYGITKIQNSAGDLQNQTVL